MRIPRHITGSLKFQALNEIPELDGDAEYMHLWDIKSPLYVIVCGKEAMQDITARKRGSFRRVLQEVDYIKRNFQYLELNDRNYETGRFGKFPNPTKKPILVCGFFEEPGVRALKRALRRIGYETYISIDGTCRSSYNPYYPEEQY